MSLLTALYGTQADRDAEAAKNRALYDSRIEWHTRADGKTCTGRHGVVRGVTKAEWNDIAEMLIYFMGDKPYWTTKSVKGKFDVEFAYQCTGGYAERVLKPWQWCGESALFEDWRQRHEDEQDAAARFRPGMKVAFTYKGARKVGLVTNAVHRITVVVEGEGRYYWPASDLEIIQ